MSLLEKQFRYNAWANKLTFEAALAAKPDLVSARARGTYHSIARTLKHSVRVEDVYLLMVDGRSPEELGPRTSYERHRLDWFGRRAAELGDGYRAFLARIDDAGLERPLKVPWFTFTVTIADGLLQVLNHSAQHRAQVLSALGERGVKVPDVDYILMAGAEG